METYTVKVDEDGSRRWYQNDKLHRLDGPAVEWTNGDREWYQNDKLHRLDGPAVEWTNGDREWYQNDKLHRLDGPAVEFVSGDREWYIEGKYLTEEQFNQKTQKPTCEGKTVIIDGVKYKLVEE